MDARSVVKALAALAQQSRLTVFRLLVQAGPEGLPAGKIGEAAGIAPSSLSFHLKELSNAGLIDFRQEGRFIIYTARYPAMEALIGYLTENCCGGVSCLDTETVAARKCR